MSNSGFRNGRGYLYIGLGLAFGIYRATKVVNWETWDFLDQILALGMILAGVYLVRKK